MNILNVKLYSFIFSNKAESEYSELMKHQSTTERSNSIQSKSSHESLPHLKDEEIEKLELPKLTQDFNRIVD